MTTKSSYKHWFPTDPKLRLLHLGVWAFFFVIHWATFYEIMEPHHGLLRAIASIGLIIVLFYGCAWAYHHYYEQAKVWHYALVVALGFILIGLMRYGFVIQFPLHDIEQRFYRPGPVSFAFAIFLTNVFTVLVSLMYESLRSRNRLDRQRLLLENEQKEARLQFLRAQLNPHFLFNTLNNIYSLAVLRSEKTAPLVLRLSGLLQYVIYDGQQDQVPLKTELTQLREYIDLFQLQHEAPLRIELEVEQDREDYRLPPLLLIPIMENCFKHCDFAENPAAYVRLKVRAAEGQLQLRAHNTYNPDQKQKDRVGGVGLTNMRSRLTLRYGEDYELEIRPESTTFMVNFNLPLAITPESRLAI